MMIKMYNFLYDIKERIKDKKGQGMVEYALIIGLVAVLLISSLTFLKDDIISVFTKITTAL
jgi:pilus assembly protein Flp/PilA